MTPGAGGDRAPRPGAVYVLPAALFFAFFAVLPLVLVALLSFTEWTGIGDPRFIGTDNWTRLAGDPLVLTSTRTTLLLMLFAWAAQTALALPLGVWAAGRQRNRAVLSAIFFLPLLLSSAAIALMWKSMLDPNFGVAAVVGPWIGVPDGNLIGTPRGALICIIITVTWQFVPFHTLLYQGAARNIPAVLYDAARMDGANRWQSFLRVTLPQLRNTIVTSSVLMLVGSLTYFETILLLTGGGPGDSTYVLPFLMYQAAFERSEMGYAAAIATGLVLLGTLLSLAIVRFSGFSRMRSTLEGM
ncbi:carbohydrate ABC transporter permease [Catenuloplanes atrovinosus]|uniref:Xylobiose transport system permease protein n=1 Tax=Catenuloplanes atrovinosus TaxID=137266 RepID=A0AAE3YXY5_9ACTN|nr:sugar ABC transporter permease [Catenuloplanes atrovinosus]MDR7280645.1 xylobiose transport system permease protein [Catenuloplanes atrovinosus]